MPNGSTNRSLVGSELLIGNIIILVIVSGPA
jgi:hypothetical protein